ncbi:FKBP-type peptidyl-prolyl cis-trans isomerase [Agitococcus lubricus]|uniref:Peptidyl-prolyl cis-trans isomerase n=1 Tax=Agitococcus lubricus TaxID=1077255 RepID=A0A2T5J3X6_9GAMM|nr:FKBP-type peptidyl-prolyl cis-trans isomerase [Agitococcus lubricus]PTQ91203.1 FKBP-type peptidyl-prolyl cis-trans isomerase FklB [Agitococcus lubricus]
MKRLLLIAALAFAHQAMAADATNQPKDMIKSKQDVNGTQKTPVVSGFGGGVTANGSGEIVKPSPVSTESAAFSNEDAKVAYSLGFIFGKNNAAAIEDLNIEQFVTGFKDGYGGKQGLLSEDQIKQVLADYKERRMAQVQAEFQKQGEANRTLGAQFLAENGKKAGVTTTASGLQYEVLKEGTGAKPKATDMVSVHYEGRLTDGTVFDSSVARGVPAEFRLDQVIQGWTEGVQLMKEGSKFRLTIPAVLAYGEMGAGSIPPNAVLVFDVELLKVTKEPTEKTESKKKKK